MSGRTLAGLEAFLTLVSKLGASCSWSTLMPLAVAIGSALSTLACDSTVPTPRTAQRVEVRCPAHGSAEFYFPERSLIPQRQADDASQREAVSRFLSAISAESLSCGGDGDAYRFIWLHDYRPAFVISIHEAKDGWVVRVAEFLHPKTGKRWTVSKRFERRVAQSDLRELLTAVERARLWNIPTWVDSSVNDGPLWVFELRANEGYRVLSRHAPTAPALIATGQAFVRLAGIPPPDAM